MNDIQIRYANDSDLPYLIQNDSLVTEETIRKKISDRQVIVCMKSETHLGCMRFGFMWDMFPFLNFVIVEKDVRRKGIGRGLMEFWEQEMKAKGHKLVMTSTDVELNGEKVLTKETENGHRFAEYQIDIELKEGVNRLSVYLQRSEKGFGFTALLCDNLGDGLLDIEYRLASRTN